MNELRNKINIFSLMRLRKGSEVVGYMKTGPSGLSYSKDLLWWSNDPIEHDTRDLSCGVKDCNRRMMFDQDIVLIKKPLGSADDHDIAYLFWSQEQEALVMTSISGEILETFPPEDPEHPGFDNQFRVISYAFSQNELDEE